MTHDTGLCISYDFHKNTAYVNSKNVLYNKAHASSMVKCGRTLGASERGRCPRRSRSLTPSPADVTSERHKKSLHCCCTPLTQCARNWRDDAAAATAQGQNGQSPELDFGDPPRQCQLFFISCCHLFYSGDMVKFSIVKPASVIPTLWACQCSGNGQLQIRMHLKRAGSVL